MKTPRLNSRAGFSLVELLITMIIMTLIMGSTVVFFRSQNTAFAKGSEKMDLLQNARYTVTQVERILRTLGAGVTGQQPMLVYGNANVVAFNTDFDETDTTNYRWAVNFNPSLNPRHAVAWDVTDATAIPLSSPSYTYPAVTYTQSNGATSLAETKMFWFASDTATTRTDDYILWERTNASGAEYIARNILAYPGRPFLEYMMARRLTSGADTMIIASGSLLPLKRLWPQTGWTPTDTANGVRPDSVKAIRINFRITNGKVGSTERTRDFSQIMQVPNNGLPSPNVCGRSPFPPGSFTPYADAVPGSGIVYMRWTRSADHGGGEFDVRQYVVWSRDDTATVWIDPLIMIKADTTVTYDSIAVGGFTSGSAYDFAIAAQDCTPSVSTLLTVSTLTAP